MKATLYKQRNSTIALALAPRKSLRDHLRISSHTGRPSELLKSALLHGPYILVSLALVVLLAIKVPGQWLIIISCTAALSGLLSSPAPSLPFRSLDCGLLLFYASSCISAAFAYDTATALPELGLRTSCMLIYLAVIGMRHKPSYVLLASSLGFCAFCGEGLLHFFRSYNAWRELGFIHLVDFRSFVTLTPDNVMPANHNAPYIIGLGIGLYGLRAFAPISNIRRYVSALVILLSTACALLTFSRGLYISLLAILAIGLGQAWRLFAKRRRAIVGGILCVTIAIVVLTPYTLPIVQAVVDTILFRTRASQQLSTTGRLHIYQTAMHLARHCDFIGAGLGNYSLAMQRSHLLNPMLLTTYVFNVPLQTAIEQGWLGIVALAALVVALVRTLLQDRPARVRRVLLGCAVGLVIYGLNQSFVIADGTTAAALGLFLAIARGVEVEREPNQATQLAN